MLYPQLNRFRELFDISGIWEMAVDNEDIGEGKGWYKQIPNNTRPISVPGSWNDQYDDIHNYMGTVWYFKRFFVKSKWKEKLIWLRIGAAAYRAKIWINGTLIGKHEIGYLPFQFEVSKALEVGEENKLAVKVDYKLSIDTIPQDGRTVGHWRGRGDKFPPMSGDYFPYGGLQRPVLLYTTPKNYIEDLTIVTDIKNKEGIVNCSVKTRGIKVNKVRISIFSDKLIEKTVGIKKDTASAELSVKRAKF